MTRRPAWGTSSECRWRMCPSSSHRFSPFPKMAVASPDAVDDLAGNTATCEKAIDEESNGGMAAECPNASGYSAEISTVREECEDKEVEPDKTCEQAEESDDVEADECTNIIGY